MWGGKARVEELDSDDTDTQGVGLVYGQKRFSSDPLHYTGYELATTSKARKGYSFEEEQSASESESSEESDDTETGVTVPVAAYQNTERELVESALARIRRAQKKGRGDVKLKQEELDALERHRKRMQSASTSKSKKGSGLDRSGSDKRRRREENLVSVPIPPAAPQAEPKSRKKSKSKKAEGAGTPPVPANGPGMMFAGPDGLTYAPLGYYPPQVSSNRDSPGHSTRARSRTGQSREAPPPVFSYQTNSRHSDGTHRNSSRSNSRRPEEDHYRPSASRRSSGSSQIDPFDYQLSEAPQPTLPSKYAQPHQSRRPVSNPSDITYSSIRRSPPGAFPSSSRAPSDPTGRRRSSQRDELANSSSEEEEEEEESDESNGNGVQVFEEVSHPVKEKQISRKPVSGRGRKKGKK